MSCLADAPTAHLADEAFAAADTLATHGLCVFDGVLPTKLIDACRPYVEEAIERLDREMLSGGLDGRARSRYKVRGKMDEPPLGDPLLHGAAPWLPVVRAALGEDAIELWRGALDNRPGSAAQEWHRDGEYLQMDADAPHGDCLTCFLPLVDVSALHGPTEFMLGSHRGAAVYEAGASLADENELPTCAPQLRRGAAVLFDFRTVHRGTPNTTCGLTRPLLYIVYGRGRGHAPAAGTTPPALPSPPASPTRSAPPTPPAAAPTARPAAEARAITESALVSVRDGGCIKVRCRSLPLIATH